MIDVVSALAMLLPDACPVTQDAARRRRKKGAKLLLILNSGSRIEEVIEENRHAIDNEMLEMLEARIDAARCHSLPNMSICQSNSC